MIQINDKNFTKITHVVTVDGRLVWKQEERYRLNPTTTLGRLKKFTSREKCGEKTRLAVFYKRGFNGPLEKIAKKIGYLTKETSYETFEEDLFKDIQHFYRLGVRKYIFYSASVSCVKSMSWLYNRGAKILLISYPDTKIVNSKMYDEFIDLSKNTHVIQSHMEGDSAPLELLKWF